MIIQKNPAISVVMPVYNAQKYLDKSIDSILNQSFSDFEFIIIDDGSSDNSKIIIEKYARKDSRIKLISRTNRGLIYSLNEGVVLARSNYIARMDADDISYPDRFESQFQYMENNPEVVAVGTLVELIDSDDDRISVFNTKTSHQKIDREHMNGRGGAIIHPSALIRKTALLNVNMYRQDFPHAEDIDLWLRLAEVGFLANLNSVLFSYRQHVESIGYTVRNEQIESTRKAVEAAHKRRGLPYENINLDIKRLPPSNFDIHMKWAWWAYTAGNKKVARKYAKKALMSKPWSFMSAKLLLLTLIR